MRSSKRRRRPAGRDALVLAVVVMFGLAPAAAAQSPMSLGLGGGMTLPTGELETRLQRGYHGLATLRLGVPLVPVHLRADASYGLLSDRSGAGNDLMVAAVTGNVGYDVVPLGLAAVYVVGGGGYYWTEAEAVGERRAGNVGWNAGAGFRVSLGALRLFAEARYHTVKLEAGDAHFIPVTVGIFF